MAEEESMRDSLETHLEREENITVECAPSADLALVALGEGGFDVIISDYALPGKDGIELLKLIRSKGLDTPFILFTGRGSEEVAMQALNEGANFYLEKTGDASSLYSELADIIRRSHQRVTRERARKEMLDRFERLANATPDLIWRIRVSPDVAVEYMNPALEGWVGYAPEDFYKDPSLLYKCIHQEDAHRMMQAMEDPASFPQPLVSRWIHRNGTIRWAEDRWGIIREPSGNIAVIEGISRDITERVESEQALRQANRKLELMTGLIRHDALNKLAAILGFLDLARTSEVDALPKYLDKIETVTKLITRQLQFSSDYQKTVSGAPIWIGLRDVIQDAVSASHLENVEVELKLEAIGIFSDYALNGVFSNLIEDSVTHGKKVTRIEIRNELTDGGIDIVYEDNGIGIPHAEKQLIFQKGYGKGTGYGLFLSREILKVSNITMEENGEPGKGARFVLHFPLGTFKRWESPSQSAGSSEL